MKYFYGVLIFFVLLFSYPLINNHYYPCKRYYAQGISDVVVKKEQSVKGGFYYYLSNDSSKIWRPYFWGIKYDGVDVGDSIFKAENSYNCLWIHKGKRLNVTTKYTCEDLKHTLYPYLVYDIVMHIVFNVSYPERFPKEGYGEQDSTLIDWKNFPVGSDM